MRGCGGSDAASRGAGRNIAGRSASDVAAMAPAWGPAGTVPVGVIPPIALIAGLLDALYGNVRRIAHRTLQPLHCRNSSLPFLFTGLLPAVLLVTAILTLSPHYRLKRASGPEKLLPLVL